MKCVELVVHACTASQTIPKTGVLTIYLCDRATKYEKSTLQQVLRAEKEVTLELRRLSNLEIYPVAELAHIRREHDAMAKEWRQVGPNNSGVATLSVPGATTTTPLALRSTSPQKFYYFM